MTRVATPANESVLAHIARYGTAVARREARAEVPLDAAARRGEERAIAAPESLRPLLLRRERHVRAQRAPAAGDRRDRRARRCRRPATCCASRGRARRATNVAAARRVNRRCRGPSSAPRGRRDRADALRLVAEAFLAARSEEVESTSTRRPLPSRRARRPSRARGTGRRGRERAAPLASSTRAPRSRSRRCAAFAATARSSASSKAATASRSTSAARSRAIPPAMRRALRARDGGCRFPGCDRTRFCDGHHVKHWATAARRSSATS